MYSRIFTWFILPIGESIQSFNIIGKIMKNEFDSLVNPVIISENNNEYRYAIFISYYILFLIIKLDSYFIL